MDITVIKMGYVVTFLYPEVSNDKKKVVKVILINLHI